MKIIKAKSFKDKFLGLMFKKNFNYGLLILNCKSVHTFFMKEKIDIILLDKNNTVLNIKKNIAPNKIIIFKTKKRTNILELPNNSSKKIIINKIIDFDNL